MVLDTKAAQQYACLETYAPMQKGPSADDEQFPGLS